MGDRRPALSARSATIAVTERRIMENLSHYSATCKDNGESCWQVDEASLDHNHGQGNATIIQAEICLCGRDMCNNADPVPEVPTTTAAPGSASQATVAFFLFATPFLLL